jgi:hypothetical protein
MAAVCAFVFSLNDVRAHSGLSGRAVWHRKPGTRKEEQAGYHAAMKWSGLFIAAVVLAGCGEKPAAPAVAAPVKKEAAAVKAPVGDPSRRVVVDSIHAHNYIGDGLKPGQYEYHKIFGFHLAFSFLQTRGVEMDEVTEGKLDAAALARGRVLFINLVSADLPPFTVPEIAAIKRHVEEGSSLFVIVDHTNCYYHTNKLSPLMDELGIVLYKETACEPPPFALGGGMGWIAIHDFANHPVTAGLRTIAMQTAGTIDERYGVATTSDRAFGDLSISHAYGEGDNLGLYGNFKKDEGERTGKLAVVAAKTLGKGKVLVVTDQNLFGDVCLRYADNYRLWLNAFAWLMDDASLGGSGKAAEDFERWQKPRVFCYDNYDAARFGSGDAEGYHHVYAYLGRARWAFAGDDLGRGAELVVVATDGPPWPDPQVDLLIEHLRAGRNVLLLHADSFPFDTAGGLLSQLVAKLGRPEIQDTGKTAAGRFKGVVGRVVVNFDDGSLTNQQFTKPTQAPTPAAEKAAAALDRLIDEALAPVK